MTSPADTTEITLRNVDLALVRELAFDELSDVAKVLAEQAEIAAHGGNADPNHEDNGAGDDAYAQFRHRVQVITELLDKIGWSVLTDTATVVEYERSRRVTQAGARRAQRKGGK